MFQLIVLLLCVTQGVSSAADWRRIEKKISTLMHFGCFLFRKNFPIWFVSVLIWKYEFVWDKLLYSACKQYKWHLMLTRLKVRQQPFFFFHRILPLSTTIYYNFMKIDFYAKGKKKTKMSTTRCSIGAFKYAYKNKNNQYKWPAKKKKQTSAYNFKWFCLEFDERELEMCFLVCHPICDSLWKCPTKLCWIKIAFICPLFNHHCEVKRSSDLNKVRGRRWHNPNIG